MTKNKVILLIVYSAALFITGRITSKPQVVLQEKKEILQEEKQEVTIRKKTISKPDGTVEIDEVQSFLSDKLKKETSDRIVYSDKKHQLSYIYKYSFDDKKFYHSGIYSYQDVGLYISENKELGISYTIRF